MPTYDYQCDGCNYRFEEFQYFNEEKLKTCPKCHADKLRRLFGTGAAVIFKGSGFYETDYRSDSYKAAAKAESEGTKPAAAGANGTASTTGANGTPPASSSPSDTKSESNSSKSSSRATDD
jgi:putative FmdB family regulatory protein